MSRYADQFTYTVSGQKVPIPGADVYVYRQNTSLAALTDDYGAVLQNPVMTDSLGNFFYNTADGIYSHTYVVGGKIVYKENGILVGPAGPDPTTLIAEVRAAAALAASTAGGAAGYMEPLLLIDNANVTTNDATYQTLDLSAYIPKGCVAVYVQIATYMVTVNAGTGWALRAVGDLVDGIDNDGSYRWYPPQTAAIYFTDNRWVRVSSDRKIQYRRLNPGGTNNYWKLVLWGFQ